MAVAEMRTLADIEADTRQIYVIATGVLTIAGGLALLLSAIGLYAVVAPFAAVAAIAAVGVGVVAAAATWLPARRAAGVEPATILRGE